jgi:hypothetical protein
MMREVYDRPAQAKQRGEVAARDIAAGHTPVVLGGFIRHRLKTAGIGI